MRILFIHGRDQGGKDPVELKKTWVETLKKGFQACGETLPDNVDIDFPYYGDKLDELTAKAKLDDPDNLTAKGAGQDKQYQAFITSALIDIQKQQGITDDEIKQEYKGSDLQEKGPLNWGWVQAIAGFLDHNIFVSNFVMSFLTDVYLYINTPVVTKSINKIVEAKLTDEPTIIVSHSLGTVVAYRVILDNISKINIHKFITIGSPLGMTAISSKLSPLINPCTDDDWFNAYDERDVVSLNPLDDDHFPTDPEINNFNGVDNHTENRHGIIGYLNDKTIASEIVDALNDKPQDT